MIIIILRNLVASQGLCNGARLFELLKTTENSERLGRQVRPGFKPGISRLLVLSVTTPPIQATYDSICLQHAI